jgi:hypothetical protein
VLELPIRPEVIANRKTTSSARHRHSKRVSLWLLPCDMMPVTQARRLQDIAAYFSASGPTRLLSFIVRNPSQSAHHLHQSVQEMSRSAPTTPRLPAASFPPSTPPATARMKPVGLPEPTGNYYTINGSGVVTHHISPKPTQKELPPTPSTPTKVNTHRTRSAGFPISPCPGHRLKPFLLEEPADPNTRRFLYLRRATP